MSASTPEGRITAKILTMLNSLPMTTARKVVASHMNRAGEPDIDCVHEGRAVKLEVKRPGTEHAIVHAVTPLQRVRLLDYARCGAIVGVVTTVEEARAALGLTLDTKDGRAITAVVRARMSTIGLLVREASVGSSA